MTLTARFLSLVLPVFVLSASIAAAQFDEEFAEFEDEPAEAEPVEAEPATDDFSDFDEFESEETSESETETTVEADLEDADGEPAEEEVETDPRDHPSDLRRFRLGNTFLGTTGGFHVPHALGAPAGTFRVQLSLEFMAKNGFLFEEDGHSRVGGGLSISWAVHEMVEVYGSLASYATSNTSEFPNLLIVLGDLDVGVKVGVPLSDTVSVGGDLGFLLPTGSGLGPAFGSLGLRLRANATIDLRGKPDPKPFIARFSLGYTFDRSENLIEADENRRYDRLPDALERGDETRHLITRAERNALSIDRTDFLNIGIGLEAPLEIGDDMVLSPILEYALGVPVNRQGYVCPFIPSEPGGSEPRAGDDSCLEQEGFSSFPQTLTLGARFLPPVRGLQIHAALDVGLTGRSGDVAVRELSQTAPWKLWIGLAYAHDARSPQVPPPVFREVDVSVDVPAPELPGGRILGRVLATVGDAPIADATIRFMEPSMTSLRGAADGTFNSYRFPPGTIRMTIDGAGHNAGACEATIPEEGGDQEVVCRLERALVAVEEDSVVILEQIQFAFDSHEILEESFGLMGQIATALREHAEIRVVEIQGHTDDQGNDQYNATLSQRRAESVQAWLSENGVEAGRLRARGYGEIAPLVRDTTDEARAANRRVEFRIMERSE
ncbi:MAG: outer membrane protein OmpA-like peptidoglycan-associated protein [Polyangiales bacterium]|jgi:outer membrane protein OmpA-like peptidoglycan-associated protein